MNMYLDLFLTFARIGALTFGGGYTMLPIIQKEVVEKKKWVDSEDVLDYYAIGQCIPGIIAVNTAIFIGNKKKGVWGGIAAALGAVFPSLIIIMIIAAFLTNFADIPAVQNAFAGIRVCVCVLILNAVLKLQKKAVPDLPAAIIFVVVFLTASFTSLSPILFVLVSAVVGILLKVRRVTQE